MREDPSILAPELFNLLDGMLNPDDPAGDEFAYYPSADAAEESVTRPIEDAVAGLSGIKTITSNSQTNASIMVAGTCSSMLYENTTSTELADSKVFAASAGAW